MLDQGPKTHFNRHEVSIEEILVSSVLCLEIDMILRRDFFHCLIGGAIVATNQLKYVPIPKSGTPSYEDNLKYLAGLSIEELYQLRGATIDTRGIVMGQNPMISVVKSNKGIQLNWRNPILYAGMARGLLISTKRNDPIVEVTMPQMWDMIVDDCMCPRYDIFIEGGPNTEIEEGEYTYKSIRRTFKRKWDGNDRSYLWSDRISRSPVPRQEV